MSSIVKATVLTSSSEDSYARVKLKADGIWDETPLVMSIGQIPLVKGESVFVDVSDGYENPIILGRCSDKNTKKLKQTDGSILFQSGSEQSWVVGFVKNNKLEVHTNSNVSLVIEGSKISISAPTVEFNNGNNGGLINVNYLVQWLTTHTHPLPNGTSGVSTTPVIQAELTDNKVKH